MLKYLVLIFIFTLSLKAEYITVDVDTNKSKAAIALPYIFSTEAMGLTAGVVGIFNGYGQENMTIVATVFAGQSLPVQDQSASDTTANTRGSFLAISNYQAPYFNRLFLSLLGSYAYYPNQQIYIDGSNSSNKEDGLSTQGFNNWAELSFKYTLPLGENKDTVITEYHLKNGIPINRDGYGGGTPFITGSTTFNIKPFYNKWSANKLEKDPSWNSNGLKFELVHNNTDYIANPNHGYNFKLKYTQDFGFGNSTQTWNSVEAEYSQYIDMGTFSWSRQNVLAFNVWSAYSPSWETNKYITPQIESHRPPPWEGARLGGWERMRAYDANRFSDKAAIYYGLEYRIIPNLNPLARKSWVPVNISWFQAVAFAEVGRVAPKYSFKELHQDIKADIGLSLRALAANVPIRFDIAVGEEGLGMWVMINQPF